MYNIDTCAICRETLETSETRVLPCSHPYHKECIDSWLARVPSCPYCRTKVVTEGVNPVNPRDSVQRPLPNDDIVPWIRASTDDDVTRDEIDVFMRVVRHNPNFNRDDVLRVIHNLCAWQNFDARLLPDDDVVPWLYASRYVHIPEPVMDRFMRVLRHGFDIDSVRIVIHHAYLFQPVDHSEPEYSDALQQLIQREHTAVGLPPYNPYNLDEYDEWVDVATHAVIPEPVMYMFLRVDMHNYTRDAGFELLAIILRYQNYRDELTRLIQQVINPVSQETN